MPKRIKFFLLLVIIPALPLLTQEATNLDRLMRYRLLDCFDIKFNCLLLIPEYYEKSQIDTAMQLLDYWEERCESNLFINRSRLLFAIQQKSFDERIYDERIIYYLADYHQQLNSPGKPGQDSSLSISKMDSAQAVFDAFTVKLAESAYQQTGKNSVERLLANHFRGNVDSTFLQLQSRPYQQTALQRYYWQTVEKVMNLNYYYYGASAGIWLPQSNGIKVLGSHSELGFYLGVANYRMDANWYLILKFGSTPQPYNFTYQGQSFTTRQFLGGGLGFEWGSKLWHRLQSEMVLHIGLLFDSYSPQERAKEYDNESINSFYFSPGLSIGLRPHKLGRIQFILQGRYHLFIADLGGLKGPQGNSISLRLVFSYNWKDPRKKYLEQLSYQFRP